MQQNQTPGFKTLPNLLFSLLIIALVNLIIPKAWAYIEPLTMPEWNGFYLSAEFGRGTSNANYNFSNTNIFNSTSTTVLGNNFSFQKRNFIAGAELGLNLQYDCLVLGIQATALESNFRSTQASPFFPTRDIFSINIEWLGAVKARLGYALQDWLLYITGGMATAKVQLNMENQASNILATSRDWHGGSVFGAGVDYKIAGCLSLGLEYDHWTLRTDSNDIFCPNCQNGGIFGSPAAGSRTKLKTILGRINFHF